MTMTFWDGIDSIRAFAGDAVETAKYYPEDADFLLEYGEVLADQGVNTR
jgi:hypothetical protein